MTAENVVSAPVDANPSTVSPAAAAARRRGPLGKRAALRAGEAPPDLRAAPTRAPLDVTFRGLIDLYFAANPCSHLAGSFHKWLDLFQFGDLSAWAMTKERLKAAAVHLREVAGYADSTINRELSLLGTIYRWAEEKEHCPVGFVSPTLVGDCGRVKEKDRKVLPATKAQWEGYRKIALGSFRDRKFTLFVWLFMDTGARRGEISDRTWNDFNIDDPDKAPNVVLWHDDTKTEAPRRMWFSHETAALLRRLRPASEVARAQLVFKTARGVQPNKYRKPWARFCDLIGRPGLHLHDLRHLIAADLLDDGKGMIPVSNLLGHSTLTLKRRYGHLDDASVLKIQTDRLGLDAEAPAEFEPVAEARVRHAMRRAEAQARPITEVERLALLAQDAAEAAAAAAVALAEAQAAMRAARSPTAAAAVAQAQATLRHAHLPLVERA